MKNLLITHDIFRSRDFGMISTVENLHWIKALLKLCGRGVFHKFSTLISTADNGPIDVSPLMKQLDLPPTVESWARLVSDADLLPELINFFDSYLEDITHAFGFGLTPNFMHVLQNRGISFVDIELSPIRFSKGINFRARTNCASFHNVLQALQYPEQHHLETAMRATGGRSRKIMPSSVKRGIFTGQAQIDLAIVENSKIRHPWDEDVINAILNLTEDLDELHIIPHPMQLQRIGHLIPILHHIPKAIFSKADTYSLLTHPDTTRVISLSSGTLKESSFLGIEACALIKPDRDNSALLPSGLSEWIEVRDQLFSKETITAFSQNKNIPELNFSNKNDMMELIESTFGENKRTLMTTPNYEEAPRLSAGLRYDVVSGKIFHDILHFGWSSVEDWGVWSDGPIAELNFKISSHSGTTLTLKGLTFGRKIGEKYFSPIVTAQVVVDGKTCAAHFAYNDSAWDLTSEIPPSLQDTAVYVHFFVSGACSPRLLSINDDPRKIGLGLTEVTLSKANVTAAIDGQHQDSNYYVNAHREIRGYQENNWMMPFTRALLKYKFDTIVECAAGNGEFAETLAPHVKNYWALDWAPSYLVPYSAPNLHYLRWDAYQDALPDGNLACSADFLEHIREQQLDDVLGNILRAAPNQFHVIACYDDYHSHLTIKPANWWLDRFINVSKAISHKNQNWQLLDWPLRDSSRPIAIVTNFLTDLEK